MDSSEVIAERAELNIPGIVPSSSANQPDWSDLRTYTRGKQAVAAVVRRLGTHFHHARDEPRAEACRELMVKLAEDRFTLAVLGQFNRGKSSLMNAIMGRQILPTGVLPLTSAITVLRFGSQEQLVVERKGWPFPETAPFSALAGYVTQQGNPGNEKQVERVYVELPLPFLRRGLEFVDTPGVGSAIDANTATTMDFLPRCDAALFVTSVDTPLTAVETDLLSRLRQYVRKIIFIINKTDLLDDQECQEVVAYIVGALHRQMRTSSLLAYATSSKRGLAAKATGNHEAYRQSGLGTLEEAISSFLALEKSSTFLVAILDKATAIASREARELDVARQAQGISPDVLLVRLGQLQDRFHQLKEERDQRLLHFREQARQRAAETIDAELRSFLAQRMPVVLEQLDREVNDSHGWWLSGSAELAGGRALSGFWARLTEWVTGLKSRLEEEINEATGSARTSLESELATIPSAAVSVMGGVPGDLVQQPDDAEPLPSHSLPPLALRKPQWTPKITGLFKYVLVPFGRRRLRECLRNQLEEAIAACRIEVSRAVDCSVNQAVDQLATTVQVLASRAESRLMKALNAQAHGAPPLAVDCLANADLADGRQEIAEIQQSLSSLRDAILRHDSDGLTVLDRGPAMVVASAPPRSEAKVRPTASEKSDLPKGLPEWACPVCNGLMNDAFDFYFRWQYSFSTDEPTQRAFADQSGFCPLHTWQLASLASPQGLSLGYPKLLERVSTTLSEVLTSLSEVLDGVMETADFVTALVGSPQGCQVCRLLQSAEQERIARLSQVLAEPAGRDAYARGHGVCLRHLAALLATSPSADLARFLLGKAVRHFDELAEDMRNYAIKRDAIRSGLLSGDEKEAHFRALAHLAGHKGLCAPWSADRSI